MKDLNCIDCKNIIHEAHEEPCFSCTELSNFYPVDISEESESNTKRN